jgi:archaellin
MINKKAQSGIGTMILFIAGIIVAGITASVLLQTTGSLQSQAFKTGNAAKSSVSTSGRVISITATDGSDYNIEDFKVMMKLSPGSDILNLKDALVGVSLTDDNVELKYGSGSCVNNQATGYYTNSTNKNGTFTLDYLNSVDGHKEGYLKFGEVVQICFASPKSISEDQEFMFEFYPSVGIPIRMELVSPYIIQNTNIAIYP